MRYIFYGVFPLDGIPRSKGEQMIKTVASKVISFLVPSKVTNIFTGLQSFLSGKKTYLAATILLLQAVSMLVDQFAGLNGVGGLYDMIKNFTSGEGFGRLAEALAVFGLRAALPIPVKK